MRDITYLKGDATSPQTSGIKIIAHICNDIGGWGKGFVLAISKRWINPEKEYREWHRNRSKNDFGLGAIQIIQVEPYIYVANMVGQRGTKVGRSSGVPVRYDSIETCLEQLSQEAKTLQASVHMPRIGCGLSGGKWDKVEPLILKTLSENDIPVYVYDFD